MLIIYALNINNQHLKNFILQNHVQPRYGVWLPDYNTVYRFNDRFEAFVHAIH